MTRKRLKKAIIKHGAQQKSNRGQNTKTLSSHVNKNNDKYKEKTIRLKSAEQLLTQAKQALIRDDLKGAKQKLIESRFELQRAGGDDDIESDIKVTEQSR